MVTLVYFMTSHMQCGVIPQASSLILPSQLPVVEETEPIEHPTTGAYQLQLKKSHGGGDEAEAEAELEERAVADALNAPALPTVRSAAPLREPPL